MGEHVEVVARARRAAADLRWSETLQLLREAEQYELSPHDLTLFADAAWWCCQVPLEIELRQRAFQGFLAARDPRHAAYAAWMLSVRYGLRGEPVVASGWLARAQRQLHGEPDCVEKGYVACSETEAALAAGDIGSAAAHAGRALATGERFDAPDLVALALSWQGLCSLADDEVSDGLRSLDEAMAAVAAGELDPHFTGWVSCFAVGMCVGVADIRRAARWAQASWDWASSLPEPTPYQGLCRVRQVEIMSWRGELETATTEAHRACEEMLDFEPHLAGEAFVVTGEILLRRGDLVAAEEAFTRARTLGADPQPGSALVRLAQGRVDAAVAALRSALTDAGAPPFRRAATLSAMVEAAVAAHEPDLARASCVDLDAVADSSGSEAIRAMAGMARGRLHLAEGDAEAALAALHPATAAWRALGLRCDLAAARRLTGLALRALGDAEGASVELAASRDLAAELGATAEAERAAVLAADAPPPAGLSLRECEVLRLVAAGHTNRQIATALVLSQHTVARHLSNIYTKLGVSSRTAATAFAFEHDLC